MTQLKIKSSLPCFAGERSNQEFSCKTVNTKFQILFAWRMKEIASKTTDCETDAPTTISSHWKLKISYCALNKRAFSLDFTCTIKFESFSFTKCDPF